jgi:Double-GTPase 2
MKIMMLGHSGAGKTTYLSLMYAEMQEGIAGFRVQANDDEQHKQLLRDARQIRASRYPPATRQRASYDLTLSYNGSQVLPFTWRDHRGGAASGRSTDGADVAQLTADLKEADGIVIFIDSVAVSRDRAASRMAAQLSTHVLRAMHERAEVLTPLLIAATKSDLIDLDNEKVTEAIFAPVEKLARAVAETRHIVGTIIPVSCGPSPLNVVVPVLWSLCFGVTGMAMRLNAEAEESARAMTSAAANDTLTDRIVSWWRSERSWAAIAESHRQAGLQALRQLDVLIPPAQGLETLLEGIQYF